MTDAVDAAEIQAIRKRLVPLSLLKTAPELDSETAIALRQDLSVLNQLSDYQTLGICADSLGEGQTALEKFLGGLGVTVALDLPEREGPVYIKFNTLKGAWYLDDYSGTTRGVLVTFHIDDAALSEVNGTYGPFPLNLFG
ncbi:DUF1824 domain-containing protein [filamentous cyanobacterium CCP5]|nr:DUF1824 domain-containing protein [filamentous cyanobacterium CCP5]